MNLIIGFILFVASASNACNANNNGNANNNTASNANYVAAINLCQSVNNYGQRVEDKESETFRYLVAVNMQGDVTCYDKCNYQHLGYFNNNLMFKELFDLSVLNQCAVECTKQSRWKETTQRYMANMLVNNLTLKEEVLNHKYRVQPTTDFMINERGRIRKIEAPAIRDRIVQKTITKNILTPLLSSYFIYDNYASLKHRGTSFARKRFEVMLKRYIAEHGTDGYILQIDIRKYFENIDHEVLKKLLAPRLADLPSDVVALIYYIIDTSSKTDKGINLGSEAPQIFAIYYLSFIDHFIKVVKGVKYYGRYMDDILIIGSDKSELKALCGEIETELSKLKLETNKKKTHIVKLSHGFTFLQIKYDILDNGKILKRVTHKKVARERKRLKAFKRMCDNGEMKEQDVWNCYQSWRGTIVKEHNAYYKTISSLDNLYMNLFPQHTDCKEKPSRKTLVKRVNKEATSGDIKYLSN